MKIRVLLAAYTPAEKKAAARLNKLLKDVRDKMRQLRSQAYKLRQQKGRGAAKATRLKQIKSLLDRLAGNRDRIMNQQKSLRAKLKRK